MAARNVVFGFSLVSAALFVALAGCGGIDEPDLFNTDGVTPASDAGGKDAKADAHVTGDAGGDDGSVVDSAPGPVTTASVACAGAGPCESSNGEECCFSPQTTKGQCVSSAGDCSGAGEVLLPCDDTADCDALGNVGDVCCAQADQNGIVSHVQCRAVSDCSAKNGQTNLCDPSASNPCPNGGTCQPSKTSIPGYSICRN
ncbi:MAG: hypothetical protein ABI551_14125 [Polyangiaceae bacterium]